MLVAVLLASILATTPAPTEPMPNKQNLTQQPMMSAPTKVYDLSDKKKRK